VWSNGLEQHLVNWLCYWLINTTITLEYSLDCHKVSSQTRLIVMFLLNIVDTQLK